MAEENVRNGCGRRGRRPLVALALAIAGWVAVSSCGETAGPTTPDRAGLAGPARAADPAAASADLAAEPSYASQSPFLNSAAVPQNELIGFITRRVLTFIVPAILTDPRHA